MSALRDSPRVVKVFSSDANFVMVKTRNGQEFRETARRAGILVRTFDDPLLADCVRITVGRPTDNDQLLRAVGRGAGHPCVKFCSSTVAVRWSPNRKAARWMRSITCA